MAAPMLSRESHHHHLDASGDQDDSLARKDGTDGPAEYVPASMVLPTESFLRAAISLKEQVVEMTWTRRARDCCGDGACGRCIVDPTLFTGLMGTAFLCLRSYEATGNAQDLATAAEIADACTASPGCSKRGVTFLCGRAGIYALGAVISHHRCDYERCKLFLDLFLEVANERALPVGPEDGGFGMSYDLLHGRTGFLWSALFINRHLGPDTVTVSMLKPIVEAVLAGGRAGASDKLECPLMYRWHGTRFWGAAHGVAGIIHVLLHFPLLREDIEDVKETLRYMVRNRFPCSGNYPSSDGNPRDKLVLWSHGAGGIAITLCKAAQVSPDNRILSDAAMQAGEVVWKRGLVSKVGLHDGVSGNAYVFLSLYKLTGDIVYLERAKNFASFIFHNADNLVTHSHLHDDHAYSLFQGMAGLACLWLDMLSPQQSRFPGFEI